MRSDDMSSKLLFFLMLASVWILGAFSARADYASLANGFQLHVERREDHSSVVRLFLAGGGYVDLAPSQLVGYEKEDAPQPLPETKPAGVPNILIMAGIRHGLDPLLLKSIIAEESNFNSRAVSHKGAAGLMQLMPETAEWLGVKDFFSAAENVEGGALYLQTLLERYRGDLVKALAAYNAGPAKVDRYQGIPPYAETQNYVRRVIERFNLEKTKK